MPGIRIACTSKPTLCRSPSPQPTKPLLSHLVTQDKSERVVLNRFCLIHFILSAKSKCLFCTLHKSVYVNCFISLYRRFKQLIISNQGCYCIQIGNETKSKNSRMWREEFDFIPLMDFCRLLHVDKLCYMI